ncbi:hypothetical protein OT109_01455 [Phycisphaeraceae bacterium D3-23]
MSGLNNIKRRAVDPADMSEKVGLAFQRELGEGFGLLAFAAGLSLGEAIAMREASPDAVGMLDRYYTQVLNTEPTDA